MMNLLATRHLALLMSLLLAGTLWGCPERIVDEEPAAEAENVTLREDREERQQRREERQQRREERQSAGESAGGSAAFGQNFEVRELTVGGNARNYVVYTPPSYDPNRPAPVVIGFHGGTTSNDRFDRTTNFHGLANEKGFLVVYPNGIDGNWNDGRGTVNQDIDDVAFVRALIEELKSIRNVDADSIYVTGISNGGYLVQLLACELSGEISAFASVAASLPARVVSSCNPDNPVAMLMINSPDDRFVPWEGGEGRRGSGGNIIAIEEAVRFWRQKSGCAASSEEQTIDAAPDDGTQVEVERFRSCRRNSNVVFYKIEEGGHTWPGGEEQPEWLVGLTSRDIDATRVIWNFFEEN